MNVVDCILYYTVSDIYSDAYFLRRITYIFLTVSPESCKYILGSEPRDEI